MRPMIGIFRLFIYGLTCVLLIPVQALIVLTTKGPAAYFIPRYFHRFNCRLFNIKVTVKGQPVADKRIIFVGNHLSYLDIEVISAVIDTSFVAKEDVKGWPLFGILARLQQTVFITRDAKRAEEGKAVFRSALTRTAPLILFAEGTSGNGAQILPFKSTLFEPLLQSDIIIQPFTLSLTHMDGKAVHDPAQRDAYAYYGDTVLAPHLWQFAKSKGAALTLTFHAPLDRAAHPDRKSLAAAAQTACAAGLELGKNETP